MVKTWLLKQFTPPPHTHTHPMTSAAVHSKLVVLLLFVNCLFCSHCLGGLVLGILCSECSVAVIVL